jgi:hypothetical protein
LELSTLYAVPLDFYNWQMQICAIIE